jgi:hypothetical protein
VTLAQIDDSLGALRQASERMTDNLMELENDDTRKVLDQASLTGVTADRWGQAKGTLAQLWQWFSQFKELLDQAAELRGSKPRLDQERLARLDRLVNGPSIEVSNRQLPLAERGLFGPAETTVHCSPNELLARMSDSFDHVKEVVVATSQTWSLVLPRLQTAQTELASADRLATSLQEQHVPELDAVRVKLDRLGAALATDPLSLQPGAADQVIADLTATRRDLEELAGLRDNLVARLDQADGLWAELQRTVEVARDAHAEAELKIASPGIPAAPRLDPSFGGHLDRVKALATRSEWRAARRELREWTRTATSLLANARRVAAASRLPLDQRDELRGRLDAYRAKANRLGLLEDSRLSGLYDRAHQELYSAPTNLTTAEELVRRYQQSLPVKPSPGQVSS